MTLIEYSVVQPYNSLGGCSLSLIATLWYDNSSEAGVPTLGGVGRTRRAVRCPYGGPIAEPSNRQTLPKALVPIGTQEWAPTPPSDGRENHRKIRWSFSRFLRYARWNGKYILAQWRNCNAPDPQRGGPKFFLSVLTLAFFKLTT